MILLAFAGLLLWHRAWQVLLASVALAAVAVGLLGSDRGSQAVRRLASQLPYLSRQASHVDSFLASSRTLYTPRNLAIAVGIGVVSWSGEALAFYLVLTGLGIHASWTLLIQATFILCISTLVGSLSLLPGGLGAADFSVAGLLQLVAQLSRLKATAATLLIRFCTLWFGVSLGLLALFLFRGRFHSPQVSAAEIEALQAAPR
jgi:uncharacterized protein (TIRG00374 family)